MRLSTINSQQLSEASALKTLLGSGEEVDALVKYLHQGRMLAHNTEFVKQETPKTKRKKLLNIDWAQLKADNKTNYWLLFKCEQGIATVKIGNNEYRVIVAKKDWPEDSVDPETGEVTFGRDKVKDQLGDLVKYTSLGTTKGNNYVMDVLTANLNDLLDIIERTIGAIKEAYMTTNTAPQKTLQLKRDSRVVNYQDSSPQIINVYGLRKKFKPLILRSILQAEAEIGGAIAISIKAKGYKRASALLEKLKALAEEKIKYENNSSRDADHDLIHHALTFAQNMAAAHVYHDEVESVSTVGRGTSFGAQVFSIPSERTLEQSLPRRLLVDITNGDAKKLSVLLAYFKRYLMMVHRN